MRCVAVFTNEQLKAMIRQEIISEQYPYSAQDEKELKNYLKAILADLGRANIRCNVERDHFGSGYASYYAHIFSSVRSAKLWLSVSLHYDYSTNIAFAIFRDCVE